MEFPGKTILTLIALLLLLFGAAIFFRFQKASPPGQQKAPSEETPAGSQALKDMKSTVPLDRIVSGGPPKDGIPSIDNPQFADPQTADAFLSDTDPGVAVSLHGIDRFYSFQILVWHEIVNDTFKGERVLVTYCPLCFTAIVFDPLVQGERVEFGVSGKLYESNLVMYDRKTNSYWSQILGEAIVGEMAGETLEVLPSDITTFGEWKKKFPNGEVLSLDTGAQRFYGTDPYGNYYSNDDIFFRVSAQDDWLDKKDFILGIVINGKAKAYYPPTIRERGEITDVFEGKTIIATHNPELNVVRLYEQHPDGKRTRINPFGSFWFSWVAVHPDTEIYK